MESKHTERDARAKWELLTWKQRRALVTEWAYIADGYAGAVAPVLVAEYFGKKWYICRWGYFPA